jgi:hypothetical protein
MFEVIIRTTLNKKIKLSVAISDDQDNTNTLYIPLFAIHVKNIWSHVNITGNNYPIPFLPLSCFFIKHWSDTIICRVKANKYLFIGPRMYSFQLPPDERIIQFYPSRLITTHFYYDLYAFQSMRQEKVCDNIHEISAPTVVKDQTPSATTVDSFSYVPYTNRPDAMSDSNKNDENNKNMLKIIFLDS